MGEDDAPTFMAEDIPIKSKAGKAKKIKSFESKSNLSTVKGKRRNYEAFSEELKDYAEKMADAVSKLNSDIEKQRKENEASVRKMNAGVKELRASIEEKSDSFAAYSKKEFWG